MKDRTDRRGSGWTEAYATRTQERARRGGATRRADHQEGRRGEATGTPPLTPPNTLTPLLLPGTDTFPSLPSWASTGWGVH